MTCHSTQERGKIMVKIKKLFGFIVAALILILKVIGAVAISMLKIFIILTVAVFKIVFSLIRVVEYN